MFLVSWNALAADIPSPHVPPPRRLALAECILTALLQNHALQIERLNPAIARDVLSASYGYYDPVLFADARRENLSDAGGFDPADFSRDAIYEADSQVARGGLAGFLPGGMSYLFDGGYANSEGTRNFRTFDSYKLTAGVSVRQPLLKNFWIDQGRMTIRINKRNLKITELGVQYETMNVINLVQQAYYDLWFAHESSAVQERLVATRERFAAGIRRQIENGMMSAPDEQLALSQLAAAQVGLVASQNLGVLAGNALKNLLGEGFTNHVGALLLPADPLMVLPEPFDLQASWTRGLQERPDLAQLRQDLAKADIDRKYRLNQLFPSLDLVAGYSRKGASTDQYPSPLVISDASLPYAAFPPGQARASATEAFRQLGNGTSPSDFVGIIFSLPLGQINARGNYRVSKYLKQQAALLVRQQEELVMRQIADAIDTARSSLERVDTTRRAATFARAALEAEERRLQGGKSTLFFVLQLQRDLATAELAEARAKADYNKAVSQWHFAEGSLAQREQINFEFE